MLSFQRRSNDDYRASTRAATRARRGALWATALALVLCAPGCARRVGFVQALAHPCPERCELHGQCCRPCALGHPLKCRLHAWKEKKHPPVQLPPEDMPDFPRFHPVPLQPVFSRRDFHGFPVYGDEQQSVPPLGKMEDVPPGELALPDPALGARRSPAARGNFQPASWIFTPPQAEATGVVPPRLPRPDFREVKPRTPNARPAGR